MKTTNKMTSIYITPSDLDEQEIFNYILPMKTQCSFKSLYYNSVHDLKMCRNLTTSMNALLYHLKSLSKSSLDLTDLIYQGNPSDSQFIVCRQQGLNEIFKRSVKIYKSLKRLQDADRYITEDFQEIYGISDIDYDFYHPNVNEPNRLDISLYPNKLDVVFHPQSPLYKELSEFIENWG